MEASKKEKWSIGDFYNQSWDLTWKNKKLWILGLAVSLYAGGGGSGGGNSSFDSNNLQNLQENQQQEQQLPESPYSDFEVIDDAGAHNGEVHETAEEALQHYAETPAADAQELDLGQTEPVKGPIGEFNDIQKTGEMMEEVSTPVTEGLKEVPGHVWGLLALEFLIIFIGLIALGFFLVSWAQGALIYGVAQAASHKKIELQPISSYAITKVKSLVWISLVPFLKFILKVLIIGIGGAIALAILVNLVEGLSVVAVFAGIAAVCWFFYESIRLAFTVNYAMYYCVEDDLSGPDAFTQAYTMIKGNIWKSARLAFANAIVIGIVTFAVFLPVLGVGFGTVFKDAMNDSIGPMSFVPAGITLLLTMPVMTLVSGIGRVFTFSTWHYAFKALK